MISPDLDLRLDALRTEDGLDGPAIPGALDVATGPVELLIHDRTTRPVSYVVSPLVAAAGLVAISTSASLRGIAGDVAVVRLAPAVS